MSRRRWGAVCALALAVTAGCSPAGGVPAQTERTTSGGHLEAVNGPRRHAALLAALTYVRLWARPTLGRTAWHTGVQPVVTPAYAQRLAVINPADIPARVATGSPRLVSADTAVVVADVPTDVGLIRVTVANTGGRWLIDNAGSAPTP
jgi:ABC-type Fe3+-hydroxamate transport system substrate-binding protein